MDQHLCHETQRAVASTAAQGAGLTGCLYPREVGPATSLCDNSRCTCVPRYQIAG